MTTHSALGRFDWRVVAGAIVLLALMIGLYFPSLVSMWRVWGDSNTYTHGYLVFPMVGYLIFTQRRAFSNAPQRPLLLVAIVLVVSGLLWVMAELLNVEVIGQLVFVCMIALLCLSYFGLPKTATILFPLAYMIFAVPMGEALVPKLMDITADFTVWALRVSGLPVFRDGMFFSIPAGDFEVAKACSGIRYLMASFALGTLYAYLSFRSFKKQLLFSALSLIVPILANGIRAYGIVMIAHFSNMQYAVGVDHLLYGWLFFGLVMFLLFYVGGKFRSHEDFEPAIEAPNQSGAPLSHTRLFVTIGVLAVALVLPKLLGNYTREHSETSELVASLPLANYNWQGPSKKATPFEPHFDNFSDLAQGHFQNGEAEVFVWVYRYRPFVANFEMITETNVLADLGRWAVFQQRARSVADVLPVVETELGDRRNEYTVWHWYQLNDNVINGRMRAKFAEATELLSGTLEIDESLIVLATPERGAAGVDALTRFVTSHGDSIRQCAATPSERCASIGMN